MNHFSNVILIILVLSLFFKPLPKKDKEPQETWRVFGSPNINDIEVDTTYEYSIEIIKKWEKYAATRYQLFGDEYIGYGHLLFKNDTISYLSEKQADSLVRSDFDKAITCLDEIIKIKCPAGHISSSQKHVLSMFAFNCGIGKLQRSSLLEMVFKNAPDSIIQKQYYKYVYAGKRPLPKLLNRRIDEFKIW